MALKKGVGSTSLIEIIGVATSLSLIVNLTIFFVYIKEFSLYGLLIFIIMFVIGFFILPFLFGGVFSILNLIIENNRHKNFEKYTKEFPDNCYIDKINNEYFIKPLPFLSNHEKLKIMKEIEEKDYKINSSIKRHLDDQAGYGARYFYLRINDTIYIAGSYPDLKYGNIENYEEF